MTTNARLRAFVAVAETGSVHAAAERLFVTESSVSAAVSALAREVGVALIERRGRGLRLTLPGEVYASYARRILGLHDEALGAARGELDPERGLVRIVAVTTAGEHILPQVLASFRHEHPRVELRLEVATRDGLWPLLDSHGVDLVFAGRPPDELDVCVRAVRANALVVVGAPSAARGFSVEEATWLMREAGSGTRATCEALLGALEVAPTRLTLGSTGAVVAGAVAGLGVTLVSRDAVAGHLAGGQLVELDVPGTPLDRPWHAVTHHVISATTQLLIRHLLRRGSADAPGWCLPPPPGASPGRSTARGSRTGSRGQRNGDDDGGAGARV